MGVGSHSRFGLLLLLAVDASARASHVAPRSVKAAPLLHLRGGASPPPVAALSEPLLLGAARKAPRGSKEPPSTAPAPPKPRPARLALNLLLWWSLNVLFNLWNKQCLDSWRHPWALAATHLAVGTGCMLPLWLPLPRRGADGTLVWRSLRKRPSLALGELRELWPVVALLATGHVTSTLAPAYGTVAFSNIIKTAEPLFTCIFSVLLYRRVFPTSVYFSLLLVVTGVALFSSREVNFSAFSLGAGMLSNAAFALYSICAKRLLVTRDAQSTYAVLTALSCVVLTPVAVVMEWSGAGASRLAAANLEPALTGGRLAALLVATGLVQYLSNEVAFCTLSMIHPITYALANTLKRSIVVVASLVFFRQSLPATGAAGAGIALTGALGYSIAIERAQRRARAEAAAAEDGKKRR